MATSVSTATMTVVIEERLNLNGIDSGSKTTRTISGIGECQRSIKRCIEDKTTQLVNFDQGVTDVLGSNEWFDQKVKYVRITNLEAAGGRHVELVFDGTADDVVFRLLPGESFLLTGGEDPLAFTIGTGATGSTFTNLRVISCHVTTTDVDVEVIVAAAPAT
jgi:hypothetical protein